MGPKCPSCGSDLSERALGMECQNCLNRRYHTAMLVRERDLASEAPLWLAHDARTRSDHLALAVDPGLSYCGLRLMQPVKHRRKVERSSPLDGACTECVKALRQIETKEEAS